MAGRAKESAGEEEEELEASNADFQLLQKART